MRATISGVELHVEVRGAGEPVLLVHGFPLSARLWDETAAALEGEYRLVIPDLRGHGRSEPGPEVELDRYADDLAELLDALGERRPVVVAGLSMGGYVALAMLRRHPGRVRALALVDTRAGPDTPEAAAGRRELAERVLREGSGVVADAMVDRLFARGAPPSLRERWRAIMASTPPAGVAAALRAMAGRPDSQPALRAGGVPVLAVVGEEDAVTPPAEARRMLEGVANARLEVIPGAGHLTPVERPAEWVAVLRDFLRGLPPLDPGVDGASPAPPTEPTRTGAWS